MGEGKTDDKVRKSLRASIWEGSFASAMVGFGESFFNAFAVFLQATSMQLGLLGSAPQLLGSLSQLLVARLIKLFGSRKRLLVAGVLLQAAMLIPIMLVFLSEQFSVWLLLLFVGLYYIFGMLVNPAWTSWMGDLVDANERGSYFGRRNRIAGMVSFFALLTGGFVLQHYKDNNIALTGFMLIFSLAILMRLFSVAFMLRQYEPEYRAPELKHGFKDFLRGMSSTNYGLLVLFLALMNAAVAVSGPFFAAYQLNDLGFSYMMLTLSTGASLLLKYLLQPVWGRAADKYGTYKVLTLTAILLPTVPVLWAFGTSFSYILAIQLYSGFVWAGFEIASFNFLLDATEPEKRASYLAYYNVVNGVFVFVGAVIGGLIIKYGLLTDLFWSQFIFVFVLSGILRGVVTLAFAWRLKEVRSVEHISYKDLLFDVLSISPNMGIRHQVSVIDKELLKPMEQRLGALERQTRRLVQPIVKPIEPIMEPIVKPLRKAAKPVVDELTVVKEAAGFPRTMVKRTVKRLEPAPDEVVKNAELLETKVAAQVTEVAQEVSEKAQGLKEDVAEKAQELKEDMTERAQEFRDDVVGKTQELKEDVEHVTQKVRSRVRQRVKRRVEQVQRVAEKLPVRKLKLRKRKK